MHGQHRVPTFKWMRHNIKKLHNYALGFVMPSFTSYHRYCFKNPKGSAADDGVETFWIEDTPYDVMTSDNLALIHRAKRTLQSPCAMIVLAVVALLFYCAPAQHVNSCGCCMRLRPPPSFHSFHF
jgi:hypothetical protein